jgi:hypothetical protein
MKSDFRDEPPPTKLINKATPVPSVQIDCSTWDADIPADQWTTCKLIPAVTPVAPATKPFTNWDTPPWLELVVAFTPGSSPLHAVEQANRVIGLLQAGGHLSYDASRSRTEEEAFIIALVPANRATEEQLASMVASLPPGSPTVRVARAA